MMNLFKKNTEEKRLRDYELSALKAVNGLFKQERYKLEIISRSLGKIYKGEQWVKTQTDIVKAIEYSQSSLIRQLAKVHGFEDGISVDIDLSTGVILPKRVEKKEEVANQKEK